jgi:RNA polymerase sigma-70 factor (ECF subfamily)
MELCIGVTRLSLAGMSEPGAEAALIERCRQQDPVAFGKFVDAYQNRVFGFVRRMVPNAEEAADITQEVFIRAFQSFHRFDGRSSVRTWLFRIAYNLCVDRARKVDRSIAETSLQMGGEDGEETYDVADNRWEPEQIALDEELAGIVEQGIASMSEKLRSVLLLHDREDLPYEDIAKMLNVPVGTVKSRLFLARAHLQNALKAYLNGEAS